MEFQKPICMSPHIAEIQFANTQMKFLVAINRALIKLGAPTMRQEELIQDVADRVRPLNSMIADCNQSEAMKRELGGVK